MIHHYVNLVCWRPILDIFDRDRDVVWVDSFSLLKLVHRFRSDVEYRPGTTVMGMNEYQLIGDPSWFFLVAATLENLPADLQYVLPMFDEIELTSELRDLLSGLKKGTKVAIGISAPKQNFLAVAMHAFRPDLEYHCLGAALAECRPGQIGKSKLAGTGWEWTRFLVSSPVRTFGKIAATLKEWWALQVDPGSQLSFKQFCRICQTATPTRPVEESL